MDFHDVYVVFVSFDFYHFGVVAVLHICARLTWEELVPINTLTIFGHMKQAKLIEQRLISVASIFRFSNPRNKHQKDANKVKKADEQPSTLWLLQENQAFRRLVGCSIAWGFQLIAEAYEVLSKPATRKEYDELHRGGRKRDALGSGFGVEHVVCIEWDVVGNFTINVFGVVLYFCSGSSRFE